MAANVFYCTFCTGLFTSIEKNKSMTSTISTRNTIQV